MRREIILIFAATLLFSYTLYAQKAREFPYEIIFDSSEKPEQIVDILGAGAPEGKERYTVNGIVLTKGESSSSGFILDKIQFTSDFGLTIEFEYAMYDGEIYNGNYGDGLSFFLYDGTREASIGSWGSGLGYVYRDTSEDNKWFSLPGLDGGYLALGLDLYGGFKNRLEGPFESREGIKLLDKAFINYGRNHLTLRGAQADASLMKGYPVLYTTQLDNPVVMLGDVVSAMLDYATGDYLTTTENVKTPINIRPGRDENQKIQYNKVTVILIPNESGEEMYISIKVKNEGTEATLLSNFLYTNEFKTYDFKGDVYSFETKIPDVFKLGFAAAAGGAYQDQAIRSVRVSLPYSPETNGDTAVLCLENSNHNVAFSPFDNDVFYKGSVMSPDLGNDETYIDFESFQFENEEGFVLDPLNPHYYQDKDGRWEYSPTTQQITFTLLNKGAQNVKHQIYYSAKGHEGVFATEYYRSKSTLIEVRSNYCTVPVNKNIRTSY